MRSILTVTTPATSSKLTTRTRVKQELGITDNAQDALLDLKIEEASADIEAFLNFRVPRETVAETFWFEAAGLAPQFLVLDRAPNVSIDTVTVDDVVYDAARYRLDATLGLLYALDLSGFPGIWYFYKAIVVAYSAGYVLPGDSGSNLPAGIEGATVELVTDYWRAKGRDPSIRSEDIPGVRTVSYWIGAVGEAGELPPRVVMKLAPYRRAVV